MGVVIETKGISKQFFRKRADSNIFYPVHEVDFTLKGGEIAVISGASGSGKTTFINMISGILEPSEGEINILGKEIYNMNDEELSHFRNENIGTIPQGQTAIHSLTIIENVLLPFTMYNKDKDTLEKKRKQAEELLEKLQILELRDVMPSELSGGELRRMAVARAMIMEPSIIIADEPTSDLDDKNTEIVLNMLKELSKKGIALLIVTHDKGIVEFADIKYKMQDGILKGGANEKN